MVTEFPLFVYVHALRYRVEILENIFSLLFARATADDSPQDDEPGFWGTKLTVPPLLEMLQRAIEQLRPSFAAENGGSSGEGMAEETLPVSAPFSLIQLNGCSVYRPSKR